ncbi:MAG: hypothetical protein P8Z37_07820 [Acidobacteriota bacterium]
MKGLRVECYAGYKSHERPIRFSLQENIFEIVEIEDRWYGPSDRFFKVRADDANIYILRYDEQRDTWSLSAYRESKIKEGKESP